MKKKLPLKFTFLALFCTFVCSCSFSQVATATKGGEGGIHIFGEFSAGRPNYGYDWLYGPTVGGYIQLSRWIGGEARGSVMKWGPSPFHQDLAVVGPRIIYPMHKFVPYAAFDVGVAHVTYQPVQSAPLVASNKFAWEMAAGVDYKLTPRIDLRPFDFTYGKISVLNHGLNPKGFSTGIVFRIF